MNQTPLCLPSGRLLVLGIGAHPDDIEIGCGGTLLELQRRGDVELHTLILTGTPERQDEARAAAESFGAAAEPVFGGLPDARLPAAWEAVKDALHEFHDAHPQPAVVFVPRSDDAHQDHALLGQLAATVWRGALLLHYEIPKWDGDIGRPNAYVELAPETAREKVSKLNDAFPSQHVRDWWDDEFFLGILRLRGAETQTQYAEAFTVRKLRLDLA